jgi:hypothetical protein
MLVDLMQLENRHGVSDQNLNDSGATNSLVLGYSKGYLDGGRLAKVRSMILEIRC